MTQTTDHSTTNPTHRNAVHQRSLAVREAFLGGVVAASLGLAVFTVVVLLLWIISPYPDSDPDGPMHVAADLWLMAHGADLVRTRTLSGDPMPLGVTPLMISVLPCLLLYRAARHAVEPFEEDEPWERVEADGEADEGIDGDVEQEPDTESGCPVAAPASLAPRAAFGWVLGGYLLVGGAVLLYASSGPLRVDFLSGLLYLPVVAAAIAVIGLWMADVHPRVPLPTRARRLIRRLPEDLQAHFNRSRTAAVLRAAGSALVVLIGGGALLTTVALATHMGAVDSAFPQITNVWAGRVALLLVCVALLPNAIVWGAAYSLGTGFTVGAGSLVAPAAVTEYPALPHFPLLAALPETGPGNWLTWTTAAVPFAAGLSLGWLTALAAVRRTDEEEPRAKAWPCAETAAMAGVAALGCAIAMAVLAWAAGGPVGVGTFADLGPSWWLTGVATLAWTSLVGVPGALAVRWWGLRVPKTSQRRRPLAWSTRRTAAKTQANATKQPDPQPNPDPTAEPDAAPESDPAPKSDPRTASGAWRRLPSDADTEPTASPEDEGTENTQGTQDGPVPSPSLWRRLLPRATRGRKPDGVERGGVEVVPGGDWHATGGGRHTSFPTLDDSADYDPVGTGPGRSRSGDDA